MRFWIEKCAKGFIILFHFISISISIFMFYFNFILFYFYFICFLFSSRAAVGGTSYHLCQVQDEHILGG